MLKPNNNIISGIWKFSKFIRREEIIAQAQEWAQNDHNYLELYVRKWGPNDEFALVFMYDAGDADRECDNFMRQTSDHLRARFDNQLVGWELAASPYLIKRLPFPE